jgi:hypothetical protein
VKLRFLMPSVDVSALRPWADILDRAMADGRRAYAERVDAALVPHQTHLADVVLEQRPDLAYTETVRCGRCQTAVEIRATWPA